MSHARKLPRDLSRGSRRRSGSHRQRFGALKAERGFGIASCFAFTVAALNVPALAFSRTCASANQSPDQLSAVVVTAERINYNGANELGLDKLTQPLVDTPQSISSLPAAKMADQGATSLGQALRMIPGITLGAGESTWQGDNPYLRGFPAKDDMYVDGERDFGYYTRDPFDDEHVEVLEGPSAILFGQGSTGGVINQVSKVPTLTPRLQGTASAGSDDLQRATFDFDTPLAQLGPGAAFRLNSMGTHYAVADRDEVHGDRWGVAPSLALGLGTPTRLELSYFHQTSHDVPDLGIPWLNGRPAPVRRTNFYGFSTDFLNDDVNIATARFEHDFNDSTRIATQLRYSSDTRQYRETEADISKGTAPTTPLTAITVARDAFPGFHGDQGASFWDEQTDWSTRVATGAVRHVLVAGFELSSEHPTTSLRNDVGLPGTHLAYPTMPPYSAEESYIALSANTHAKTAGVYALDTLQWSNWQVMAGIREDVFDAPYASTQYSAAGTLVAHTSADQVDRLFSYRGAILYKPASEGSIYLMTGTSFDPSAEGVLSLISSGRGLAQANLNADPERTHTYELGSKWQLADDQLLLTGVLFRTEMFNARVPNPAVPAFNIVGGDERVDGWQVEVQGHITRSLDIDVSDTYLDSAVMRTTPGGPLRDAPLTNTPRNSSSLWLEYRVIQPLKVGVGTLQASNQLGQDTAAAYLVAPGYVIWNAMAKYDFSPKVTLQLNLDNFTNRNYIEEVHPAHVLPGEGAVALLSITLRE